MYLIPIPKKRANVEKNTCFKKTFNKYYPVFYKTVNFKKVQEILLSIITQVTPITVHHSTICL